MKRIRINILVLLVLVFSSCNTALDKGGFVKLLNGENLDGWYLKLRNGDEEIAKKVFSVEDGMVHVFNDQFPDSLDLGQGTNGTHGLFYTNKEYSKFILRFEYKWGSKIANNFDQWQYDAGLYYHVENDKIWPVGYEYQVRYNHKKKMNHTGDFWATKPMIWFANQDSTRFLSPDAGGNRIRNINEIWASETQNYHALDGEWNQCEVIVMEDKYAIHKLNGDIINIGTNLSIKEGKIGFQSETAEIFYRNIEIKEFDKVIPMKKFID